MRLNPFGRLLVAACVAPIFAACTDTDDTDETEGDTEQASDTEAVDFQMGSEVFGMTGRADIVFTDDAATGYSGTTQIFDRVVEDGPLGTAGDILCEYVYPATGTPFALTQDGVDSNNNPVTLACDGCEFAFELTHAAPTVDGEGPYCDIWYERNNWSTAFPVPDYVVAYRPASERTETDATGAVLQFYDGSGDVTEYDDAGNVVEKPAQWFESGSATVIDDTITWTQILGYYDVFELGHYE